jgi:hypothetical protein
MDINRRELHEILPNDFWQTGRRRKAGIAGRPIRAKDKKCRRIGNRGSATGCDLVFSGPVGTGTPMCVTAA